MTPEDLLLDARSPEGYAALEDRGYLVALNTSLSPELVREGTARDVVRLVQNARKEAGLAVSDTILLAFNATGEAAAAIAEHRAWIAGEVLADRLVLGSEAEVAALLAAGTGGAPHVETHALDGSSVTLSLRRER